MFLFKCGLKVPNDRPGTSGRILKVDGNTLIDASPGHYAPDKCAEIEEFIDRVLAIYGA